MHAMPASQLPQGQQPAQTFRSDSRIFSRLTTTELVSEGGGGGASSACDASGALSATPDQRGRHLDRAWGPPGRSAADTLRRLSVAELDTTRGTADHPRSSTGRGAPLAGHTVTLTPGPVVLHDRHGRVRDLLRPGTRQLRRRAEHPRASSTRPGATRHRRGRSRRWPAPTTKDPGFTYDRAATLAATWAVAAGDIGRATRRRSASGCCSGTRRTPPRARCAASRPARPPRTAPPRWATGRRSTGLFPRERHGYRPWAAPAPTPRPAAPHCPWC